MGWERKRGKLLDLNKLLRGQYDSFPVKIGDLSILPRVRFVITLDSDTELPRGTAHRMVGALAHPLNQAIIDPGQEYRRGRLRHFAAARRSQRAEHRALAAWLLSMRVKPVSISIPGPSRMRIRTSMERASSPEKESMKWTPCCGSWTAGSREMLS